jgi:hypothetical protein
MGLVLRQIPQPTQDEYAAMITAALRHQLSLGITSTTDAGVAPELLDTPEDRRRGQAAGSGST